MNALAARPVRPLALAILLLLGSNLRKDSALAADTAPVVTAKQDKDPPYKFWIDLATCIIAGGGAILAAVGAVAAGREYQRANRWKRAEFLASEMNAFFS